MSVRYPALTQVVELFLGDELVVIVDGGGPALLQLLCQAVQEGGPPGSRAQAGHIEHLPQQEQQHVGTVSSACLHRYIKSRVRSRADDRIQLNLFV